MTIATQVIEVGDIVKVAGNDDEWKVYWIYGNLGQAELVGAKYHRQYPEAVDLGKLTLIRKRSEDE